MENYIGIIRRSGGGLGFQITGVQPITSLETLNETSSLMKRPTRPGSFSITRVAKREGIERRTENRRLDREEISVETFSASLKRIS